MFSKDNQEVAGADSEKNGMSEAEIDEALTETFPASDPPAWTLGVDPHPHAEKK